MTRDSARRDLLRGEIAHLAARLMAEEGIQDYGTAKRKAAARLGVRDSGHLPANGEVEEALREFLALYEGDDHQEWLAHLRREALAAMRLLERFNPYLTGPVLSGTASRHSDISLHLYTDSPKEVEFFLMDRGIPYRSGERRIREADGWRAVPVFSLERDGIDIQVSVFEGNDLRVALRGAGDRSGPGRARADQVEALLREPGPASE